MLAGFLGAMHSLAPDATYSACVPFPLEPLRQRFPEIEWQPCDVSTRAACVAHCDVWLGLGGSPVQPALGRWSIDPLLGEGALCRSHAKRMFFLGVGVQTD